VNDEDGLFRGANKERWFSYLHKANASGGTPLHGALRRAGMYYEETGGNGPWGPQSGTTQLSCRQSYSILTTDGYWNNGDSYPTALGNVDNTAATVLAPDGTVAYQYTPSAPYRDGFADTLADVAMHYWVRDLRPNLTNNVPMSVSDRAFWQHMVTFGISIGLQGTQDPATLVASGNWPDPWNGSPGRWGGESNRRIDDLLHATVNGRGRFVAATDPKEFAKALTESLADIAGREASGSNVSSNGPELQAGSRIYQAVYTSGAWAGDVMAFPIGSQLIDDRIWSAADRARQNRSAFVNRKILTWSGSAGADFPTNSQQSLLARTGGMTPVTWQNNLQYIRGDDAREAAKGLDKLRDRTSPIGDIVNSSPIFVESEGTQTLYVGANDGMLHGINAASGQVLFSYVPAGISFTSLANLSNPEYDHRFFVDGGMDVATTSGGKKILVGSLGRGGKGLFALDVTSSSQLASGQRNRVLWDQTAANDTDMGYVLGSPLVLPNDDGGTVTFVGNGVDSGSGEAVLFAYVTASNGSLTIAKLKTGVAGDNALAEPRAADVDGDGTVDYVYAGDLKGNVWKFDVTGTPGTWNGRMGTRLFTAIGPDGQTQAITSAVGLAREPVTRKLFIVFGTGRYISNDDISGAEASRVQTVYGLVDDGGAIAGRNQLQERTIVKVGKDEKGRNARAWEPYAPIGNGKKGWYVDLDNPTAGERVVTRPLVMGRAMWFSSIIPTSGTGCESGGSGFLNAVDAFTGTNPSRNTDGTGGTYGYIDVNNNRKGDDKLVGEDPGSNDGFVTSVDLGIGMPSRGTNVGDGIYVCGSDGSCGWVPIAPKPPSARRVGWREIVSEG
jgi:type IV pilus assembly protein PilY1